MEDKSDLPKDAIESGSASTVENGDEQTLTSAQESGSNPTQAIANNEELATSAAVGRRRRRRNTQTTIAVDQEQQKPLPKTTTQRKRKRATQVDESGGETPSQPPAKRRQPRNKQANLTAPDAAVAETDLNTTNSAQKVCVTQTNVVNDGERPTTSAAARVKLQNTPIKPNTPSQNNLAAALHTQQNSVAATQTTESDLDQLIPHASGERLSATPNPEQQQNNSSAEFVREQDTIPPLQQDANVQPATAGSTEQRSNCPIGNESVMLPPLTSNIRAEQNQPPLPRANSNTTIYNIPSGIYIPPRLNNSENSNQDDDQVPHLYQVYFPVLVPNNNGERLPRMPRSNAFQYLHSLPVHNNEIFRQAGNFRFNPARLPQIYTRRFRSDSVPPINLQNSVPNSSIDNAAGDNATRNATHNADQYDYNARITNDARNIFSLHHSLSSNLNAAEGSGATTGNNLTPMTFSPFIRGSLGAGEGANVSVRNRPRTAAAPRYTYRPLPVQVVQQRNLRVMRRELRAARRHLLHAYQYTNSSAPDNATLRTLLQDALVHVQAAQLPNFLSLIRLMSQNRRN